MVCEKMNTHRRESPARLEASPFSHFVSLFSLTRKSCTSRGFSILPFRLPILPPGPFLTSYQRPVQETHQNTQSIPHRRCYSLSSSKPCLLYGNKNTPRPVQAPMLELHLEFIQINCLESSMFFFCPVTNRGEETWQLLVSKSVQICGDKERTEREEGEF
jgi:hypothetical protein